MKSGPQWKHRWLGRYWKVLPISLYIWGSSARLFHILAAALLLSAFKFQIDSLWTEHNSITQLKVEIWWGSVSWWLASLSAFTLQVPWQATESDRNTHKIWEERVNLPQKHTGKPWQQEQNDRMIQMSLLAVKVQQIFLVEFVTKDNFKKEQTNITKDWNVLEYSVNRTRVKFGLKSQLWCKSLHVSGKSKIDSRVLLALLATKFNFRWS